MKKIVHILIFILNITTVYSQINLIPNFDFEQYSSCPTGQDQIHLATGWSKYNQVSSTPDYYNACAPSNGFSVPQSLLLYQEDNRGCNAYAGVITWDNNGNRELIGNQLSQPLVIGQKYFISFKTVMGGSYIGGNYYESPSNNIGLKFSTVPYSTSNPAPINNFAHLRSVNIITDTANWILIKGSFIADSTYNYVMLGNFYDNSNTDTTTLNCGNCLNNYSYYLVDDICVSTDSTLCNFGVYTIPCTVSIKENSFKNQINIYPNPANNFINITMENYVNPLNITIYNTLGQVLYTQQNITYNLLTLDITNYNTGFLFIKIESINQSTIYKLLKQ